MKWFEIQVRVIGTNVRIIGTFLRMYLARGAQYQFTQANVRDIREFAVNQLDIRKFIFRILFR